jgi:hypothetical protein
LLKAVVYEVPVTEALKIITACDQVAEPVKSPRQTSQQPAAGDMKLHSENSV